MGGSDDSIGSGHMPKSSSYCSFYEERDDDGEVVQVGDLKFIDKILGSGSYATVVLAKRERKKCSQAVKSPREQGSFPSGGSFSPKISPCCKTSMSVAEVTTPSGPFSSSSGEELVAVKIFSKSVLKRVRNIKRTESNKSSKHDRQTSGGVQIEIHTALENVEREIALMKMFRHPNVVSLLQVIDCVESDALYVVLEYVPLGEIMTFDPDTIKFRHRHHNTPGLTKDGYFDEETAALFFVDVLHGLAYLHRNYISHLDLKPENILLSENGVAKISDFGNSYFFEEEKKAKRSEHSYGYDEMSDVQDSIHGCTTSKLTRYDTDSALEMNRMNSSGILKNTEGTIPFWSPEMCNGAKSFSGYASDVWAAGVCLYVFASGRLPFYSDVPSDLCHLISQANITFKDTSFSEELKELLSRILQKDPCQRVGLGEILSHDFCKKLELIG